jgi:hypothetical protein
MRAPPMTNSTSDSSVSSARAAPLTPPRSGDAHASYAIWQDGIFALRTTPYPVGLTIERLRMLGFPHPVEQSLISTLRTGTQSARSLRGKAMDEQFCCARASICRHRRPCRTVCETIQFFNFDMHTMLPTLFKHTQRRHCCPRVDNCSHHSVVLIGRPQVLRRWGQ